VLTTSVLRFAPAFAAFAEALDERDVLAVQAVVRHEVGAWARGHNPWQDDPAEGGGMLVTMGVHGVELLVALLGHEVRLTGATAAARQYRTLRSEDTAVLGLRWRSGIGGAVTFLGATQAESYEITLYTSAGQLRAVLQGGVEELGYLATLNAFLSMVDGALSPVPWQQTRAILEVLTEARAATVRS
jgi:predicted dehydrogenase